MTTHVGRRAHSPYEAGVCIRLPRILLNAIDAYAREEFLDNRSHGIRNLLEAGLKAEGRQLAHSRDSRTR